MFQAIIKLIRWRNILIVAGIQAIVFFSLMSWESSVMSVTLFIFLVFVTLCITAGGNVINDYYDRETDAINRPGKTIVGYIWSAGKVLRLYKVIMILGATTAFAFAFITGLLLYFPIYFLAVIGLQWYSKRLKCKPFIGNLLVAVYCAATVLVVAAPDVLRQNDDIINPVIWYYGLFAFLTTLYREIVKDMEDYAGDQQVNCQTFAVRYGLHKGKILAIAVAVISIIGLLLWETGQTSSTVKLGIIILQGALVGSGAMIWWAKDTSYFAKASTIIKFVMIVGTLLLLLKP